MEHNSNPHIKPRREILKKLAVVYIVIISEKDKDITRKQNPVKPILLMIRDE